MALDVEAAIADILKRTPRNAQPDALCDFGSKLALEGQDDMALTFFDRALRVDPSSARAWAARAQQLAKRGRKQEALTCMDRAIQAAPNNTVMLTQKADLHASMGERQDALGLYVQALKIQKNVASTWIKRAALHAQLGQLEEGVTAYDRALALDDAPDTWRAHAELLTQLDRLEDAAESYERALSLDPRDSIAMHGLGRVQTKLGKFEEAKRTLKQFLDLVDESDPRARKTRAWLTEFDRRSKQEKENAETLPPPPSIDSSALDSSPPTNPMFELSEAHRLLEGRHYSGALRHIEVIVDQFPKIADAWLVRGRVLMAMEQLESAAASFLHAVNADGKLAAAWRLRAKCLMSLGREQDALDAAERLKDLEPDQAETWLLLGKAYVSLGHKEEAIEALDRAMKLSE